MAKNERTKSFPVEISIPASKDKQAPALRVYLFDATGRLVDSAAAKDKVNLQIDPKQRYRISVGPDLLSKGAAAPPDLNTRLVHAGAVSRDYLPQQPLSKVSVAIEENLIIKWHFVCMNIHGIVRKLLNPGGSPPAYAPICTGVVQIFTIDLACSLGNLSDGDMLNLKNQVLANMLGVEITDLVTLNWSDFAKVSGLAAGLWPLTGNALRSYIVANRAAIAPFVCNIIPEWAICYQQLPDAAIQSDGTFSLEYCFLAWEAPPDLYFEVVQTIDGVTQEVADPDIICTTMWGYDGSQGAVITVVDPSAIAGLPTPLPGPAYLYVWPTAIGNQDLGLINGLETPTGTGLLIGGPVGTPWGGTLCLQVQFDPNLQANNIQYYRWSYQFDGDAAFTQINASVTHRWQEITVVGGVIDIHLHPVTLGPQIVGGQTNLFEIPDPTLQWIDIDDPADRPFAYFDSTAGQTLGRSGMATLKLEMFDATGKHMPCQNVGPSGKFQFILPDPSGTPNSYTKAPAANIDTDGDLIFRIRVDNNPTTAQLPAVLVGAKQMDICGMLHYKDTSDLVTIEYVATQPNNFLTWGLSVSKGSSGEVAAINGDVNSANPDYFYNSVSKLAGSCVQAAFAVNLNTYAIATDGYERLSQYDRSATIAFALLTP
jgi:hypothetical protein